MAIIVNLSGADNNISSSEYSSDEGEMDLISQNIKEKTIDDDDFLMSGCRSKAIIDVDSYRYKKIILKYRIKATWYKRNNNLGRSYRIGGVNYKVCYFKDRCLLKIKYKNKKSNVADDKRDKCVICDKKFLNRCQLRKHYFGHGCMKLHECKICSKKFWSKDNLIVHSNNCHNDYINICNVCNKGFKQKTSYENHCLVHIKDKIRYQCDFCEKDFSTEGSLVSHIRILHANEKLFECEVCNKKMIKGVAFKSHQARHKISSDFKTNQCSQCHKFFAKEYALVKHFKIVHSVLSEEFFPYKCDLCKTYYFHEWYLQRHNNTIHGCNTKIAKNDKLGVSNIHGDKLNENNLTNKGDGCLFKCNICFRAFKSIYSLRAHKKVHSAIGDYKCEECGKSFVQKISYENHMSANHLEASFNSCLVCRKNCLSISALNTHMIRHLDFRPFECEICKKTFKRKSGLRQHGVVHTKAHRVNTK